MQSSQLQELTTTNTACESYYTQWLPNTVLQVSQV